MFLKHLIPITDISAKRDACSRINAWPNTLNGIAPNACSHIIAQSVINFPMTCAMHHHLGLHYVYVALDSVVLRFHPRLPRSWSRVLITPTTHNISFSPILSSNTFSAFLLKTTLESLYPTQKHHEEWIYRGVNTQLRHP